MKKNVLLLFILLFLAGIAYWMYKPSDGLYTEASIAIEDTAAVASILIADKQGHKIIVKRTPNSWRLNDSLIARQDAITTILEILKTTKPTQPLPESYYNSAISNLSTYGIKVVAYNKNEKELSHFTIANSLDEGKSNIILKKGMDQPYLHQKVAFIGDFSLAFFTKLEDWRSRQIFALPTDSISKLVLYYNDHADSGFVLQNTKGIFEANYLNGNQIQAKSSVVKKYLQQFGQVYCSNFENQLYFIDSIKTQGRPYGFLAFAKSNGQMDTLHLVYCKADKRATLIKQYNGVSFNMETLMAYDKKDLMSISTAQWEKILVPAAYFAQ
jgi:hypothetical protein